MSPIEALRRRDGVARVETLVRDGASPYRLRKARESGAVVSVQRGWVALPQADPMLMAAAQRGVVLSCITLAERKGLWVLGRDEPHLAARPNIGRTRVDRGVVHWNVPLFPRDPDSCEDSIENALVSVARCQPHESALVIWESALKKGLIAPEVMQRVDLPPSARRLLSEAQPFADAGTESIFRSRLRWLNVAITPQAWILGHRVDFLIGERLVMQIDGGHHVGTQRTSDIRHDALLMLNGYHVIRIGYEQLMHQWPHVQAMIMTAIAQRLHVAK